MIIRTCFDTPSPINPQSMASASLVVCPWRSIISSGIWPYLFINYRLQQKWIPVFTGMTKKSTAGILLIQKNNSTTDGVIFLYLTLLPYPLTKYTLTKLLFNCAAFAESSFTLPSVASRNTSSRFSLIAFISSSFAISSTALSLSLTSG